MVGKGLGCIAESIIVGLLVILDESADMQILNEVLAFQFVLKDKGIHWAISC